MDAQFAGELLAVGVKRCEIAEIMAGTGFFLWYSQVVCAISDV